MKILGIDPGLNNIGWALLEETHKGQINYLISGKITTRPADNITIRLASIFSNLSSVIVEHKPDIASLEETFINLNPRSSMALSFARGSILCCMGLNNIPTLEFAPNTIKKTIVGNGKADKSQVMKMLKFVMPNASFESSDEADAIAIAYTGLILRKTDLL